MQKVEITIKGKAEEAIGAEMLESIFASIRRHDCADVSVRVETTREGKSRGLQMLVFLLRRHPKEAGDPYTAARGEGIA